MITFFNFRRSPRAGGVTLYFKKNKGRKLYVKRLEIGYPIGTVAIVPTCLRQQVGLAFL
jgi:hypothetical protein